MLFTAIKKYFFAAALCTLAGVAGAVPARQGWRTVAQPDGSEIKVATFGDERFHYTINEDNRLVTRDADGVYRFATVDASGAIVASKFTAMPEARLSAAARDFVTSTPSLGQMISDASTRRAAAEAFKSPMRVPSNMLTSSFPSEGEQPVLVVLVEYQDVKFNLSDPQDYYTRMLNEVGFSDHKGTGSARDYFIASSCGKFSPRFDVYRPITLSQKMAYYGGNSYGGSDAHPEEMAIEACRALDPEVDFTQYDCDHDGIIDNVFVIYAGEGEADGGAPDTVWPHAFWVRNGAGKTVYLDGKLLDHYACSNEETNGVPCGIGTVVHEFSHVMGLPDLYTTNYSGKHTLIDWSVLDQGCYLNDGRTPPLYSAFERLSMGWIEPVALEQPAHVSVPDLSTNIAYILNTDDNNEFFLFENRQRDGWDKYLPYHGMLIWRINYDATLWNTNSVNNNLQHVDLIEAGGERTSFNVPFSASSDPFPGSMRKTSFTATSNPAFTKLDGTPISTPLTEIAENGGVVTFKFNGGTSRIAAPTGVKASDISGRRATISWDAVAGASGYIVSVAAEGSSDYTINHIRVGNVLSYEVEGLEPNTSYFAFVMAIGNSSVSDESTEAPFTTDMAGFADTPVVATAPTYITATSFTANWQALPNATAYLLTVDVITPATTFREVAGYDNSQLPEGWTTTASGKYVITTNCGASTPALRFNKIGENVTTAVKSGDITMLSFWLRGTNVASTENTITVYGLSASQAWEKISEVAISTTARTVTLPVNAGYRALKIEYTGSSTASSFPVAIDDITISGGHPASTSRVLDALNVGAVTSYTVTGLDTSLTYSYTVTATDGSVNSLPSQAVIVDSDVNAGIADVVADSNIVITGGSLITIAGSDATATVFNLAGQPVYTGPRRSISLPAGLYIVKVEATVKKVVVTR